MSKPAEALWAIAEALAERAHQEDDERAAGLRTAARLLATAATDVARLDGLVAVLRRRAIEAELQLAVAVGLGAERAVIETSYSPAVAARELPRFLSALSHAIRRGEASGAGIAGAECGAYAVLAAASEMMAAALIDERASRPAEAPRPRDGGFPRPDLGATVVTLPVVPRPRPRIVPIGEGDGR